MPANNAVFQYRPTRLSTLQLGPPSPLVTLFAVALLHGAYSLWVGQAMAPDSYAYAYWSKRLVVSGFDYSALLGEAESRFPPLLYGLFVTVLALLRLAFGEHWLTGLFCLNLAAHATLGILLVRLAIRVSDSMFAGWIALLLFVGCYDLTMWVPFALSDTTFVLLSFTMFTLAAARILGDARRWAGVILLAVAGVFYRPTGLVVLPDLAWAAYLAGQPKAKVPRAAIVMIIGVATIAAAVLFLWLVQDPARWPFDFLSTAFQTVGDGYASGAVVNGRFETYHAPPTSLIDHFLIVADRFIHFFALGAEGTTTGHWIAALAFYVPAYVLAAWLIISLWRGDNGLTEPQAKVFLAAGGAIFAYAVFHAFVLLDFDWRYRLPVLPYLILLATGGAADLLRRAGRG